MKNSIKLLDYKKSNTCVLLGSGPSINNISPTEWEFIKKYDSWALNNWVYHPTFVPDFYVIEVKWYNYSLVQQRLKKKFRVYKDVVFLFPKGKGIRNPHTNETKPLRDVAKKFARRLEYEIAKRDHKRTHSIFTADYKMVADKVTKSYDMSITCIFEMLYRLGYEKIVLFGVDLYDSYYFWSGGDSKYGEVHHQWNKQHENKDPRLPHNTYKIKDFIIDFNKRWMLPKGREIVVGHTDTSLHPHLRCVSVETL